MFLTGIWSVWWNKSWRLLFIIWIQPIIIPKLYTAINQMLYSALFLMAIFLYHIWYDINLSFYKRMKCCMKFDFHKYVCRLDWISIWYKLFAKCIIDWLIGPWNILRSLGILQPSYKTWILHLNSKPCMNFYYRLLLKLNRIIFFPKVE